MAAVNHERFSIELGSSFKPYPGIRHVIFDFDGTLSLVRGGWAEIMVGMFDEALPGRPGEDAKTRRSALLADIMSLNGQPSIQQMRLLRKRVLERGLSAEDEDSYHREFQRRLGTIRGQRMSAMGQRLHHPDRHLVHGARALLQALAARGMVLHLVSGTEEPAVREEAHALGIDAVFAGRIHGPAGVRAPFAKGREIDRIIDTYRLEGSQLLSFGDGPVEIRETKRVGGLAVAVASIEADAQAERAGIDADKRLLLTASGADAVIGDYRQPEQLLAALGFPPAAAPATSQP